MRAARITDRRWAAAGERDAPWRHFEPLWVGPAAIECDVPDLARVEQRLREGAFDLLWIDLEPECVLPVVRRLIPTGLPLLISSPGGQSAAEIGALRAVTAEAAVPMAIVGELTGAPGIEELRRLLAAEPDASRMRCRMRLEVDVRGGLRAAVASRPEREKLLAAVAEALALLFSLGIRWTGLELGNPVSAHYWDRLDVRLAVAGREEGRLVVEPLGTKGRSVLDLSSAAQQLQWRRSAHVEQLVARGIATASRLFPVLPQSARVVEWFQRRAAAGEPSGGWLEARAATIEDAVEIVDRFLFARADELKRLDFAQLAEHVAAGPGAHFRDYERRRGLFQHNLIAVPAAYEPWLAPLTGEPVKLLLVRVPGTHPKWSASVTPPLGMAQIASAAGRLGVEVEQVDLVPLAAATRPDRQRGAPVDVPALTQTLLARTGGRTYDLLGISLGDPTAWPVTEALCRAVRGTVAPVTVVGGVGFAQTSRSQIEASGVIDFGVVSEGEIAILQLVRHLRESVALDAVPGLWRPGGGQNMTALTDLRFHPPPSYDGLDLSVYDSGMAALPTPFLSYQFIVGCSCRCAFCSATNGQAPRIRPMDRVIADLRQLRTRYGVSSFLFLNNMVNPSPRYVDELIGAMDQASLGIRWCDCARPARLTAAQIEGLARVGCVALVWGLDTGSQRLADLVRKQYSVLKAEEIIRIAHGHGIANYVNFIVGMPHETEADFAETRACVARLRPYAAGFNVMQYQFLPDSVLFETPREFGLRRKGMLYDEVGGLSWAEHVKVMRQRARQLEAIR